MPRLARPRVAVVLAAIFVATLLPAATLAADPQPPATGRDGARVVVLLHDGADVSRAVRRLEARAGFKAERAFRHAIKGFAARLAPGQLRKVASDPAVEAIVPDERIELAAQGVPTGVSRVYGLASGLAAIDGVDERVDADVAIVDTGIALHPDLAVAGGYDCSTADPDAWRDRHGHGTHVAGIVGALDNQIGVVGVAPGARVWAVKILNDSGFGYISWYVCGLDWILAQRDPGNASRPLFEAVNMSVGKLGEDDRDCGNTIPSAMHRAVCRVVDGGIPIAVAAMNASTNASKYEPASYNEVITVSALADTDGLPGGNGGSACWSWNGYDRDDTFADFSNYGGDIDVIAPGKCIRSTVPGGYGLMSGTSMATPLVTGAIALYRSTHPDATPSEVRTVLRGLGNQGWRTGTDPDATHEPLLDVQRIAGRGNFDIQLPGGTLALDESGGPIPITISRTAEAFEPVSFSVGGLPDGASTTITPNTVAGFDATAATLRVILPAALPRGTVRLTVTGTIQGRSRSDDVAVTFTDQAPIMGAVSATIGASPRPTATRVPIRVRWPAATEPSGVIASYRVQQQTDGGAWVDVATVGGATREVVRHLPYGHAYRFQVTATDGRGLVSAPAMTAPLTPRLVSQSAARYASSWYGHTSSAAIGGSTKRTKKAGAWASLTFTGRQVALVGPVGPNRSRVKVYLDGTHVATVDQYRSTFSARRVLFTRAFASSGRHTLKLVDVATAGRPVAEVDAFVIVP